MHFTPQSRKSRIGTGVVRRHGKLLPKCRKEPPVSFDITALCLPTYLQDVSGMSLSMLAAAGGHDDILRLLIKKGVRMNGRQKNGTTALMHAAEKVAASQEIKALISFFCMFSHTSSL